MLTHDVGRLAFCEGEIERVGGCKFETVESGECERSLDIVGKLDKGNTLLAWNHTDFLETSVLLKEHGEYRIRALFWKLLSEEDVGGRGLDTLFFGLRDIVLSGLSGFVCRCGWLWPMALFSRNEGAFCLGDNIRLRLSVSDSHWLIVKRKALHLPQRIGRRRNIGEDNPSLAAKTNAAAAHYVQNFAELGEHRVDRLFEHFFLDFLVQVIQVERVVRGDVHARRKVRYWLHITLTLKGMGCDK